MLGKKTPKVTMKDLIGKSEELSEKFRKLKRTVQEAEKEADDTCRTVQGLRETIEQTHEINDFISASTCSATEQVNKDTFELRLGVIILLIGSVDSLIENLRALRSCQRKRDKALEALLSEKRDRMVIKSYQESLEAKAFAEKELYDHKIITAIGKEIENTKTDIAIDPWALKLKMDSNMGGRNDLELKSDSSIIQANKDTNALTRALEERASDFTFASVGAFRESQKEYNRIKKSGIDVDTVFKDLNESRLFLNNWKDEDTSFSRSTKKRALVFLGQHT